MSSVSSQLPSARHINKVASKRQSIFGSGGEGVIFNYTTIESGIVPQNFSLKAEYFLSHKITALILTSLIVIYSVLVVIRIAFETETSSVSNELDILELFFLSIFVIEVALRVIAFKSIFFKYCWNLLDSVIIIVCLIVIIGEIANSSITSSQAFKLGKVLRIFRLFLMFRKMNNIKKFKDKITNKKQATVNVSSPSEKIIEILTGIMDSEWISYQNELKQDLAWCITMIKEQKIYQTSVRAAKEELIDLVSWAVNQNLFNDPESPTNPSAYSKALTLKKFSPEIESLISNCHEWDFDIFKLEQISESHSLEILVSHLFVLYNLCHTLCLDSLKFSSFTQAIEEGYHKSNTYHNATHAADVVQSYYYFLSTCQAIQICHLPDWDIAVALFSAAIHDYDHPGLNNLFLINSSNTLAMTYNDRSVLENHHVSSALRLLQEEKHNFLDRVGKDDRKKFRMKAISLVLATDFARHFSDLGKFQLKFSNNTVKDEEDRLMVLEMLMHASDVGNPSRPWKVCHEWALRVMSEFFAQGDKERELGLPISNLCDRFGVNIAKSQIGFAELFIEPTFAVLELLLPAVSVNARHLAENKEKWKEAMETEKGKD